MRDSISISRVEALHPKVRAEVKQLIEKAEAEISPRLAIRVVQGYRTFDEQAAIYAQGRTMPGPGATAKKPLGSKVTNAAPGQSNHNYGLAWDLAFIVDGKQISWDTAKDWDGDKVADWLEVVKVFTAAGWTWGGTWKFVDTPHFERTYGETWRTLLAKKNAGKVDKQGYVVL